MNEYDPDVQEWPTMSIFAATTGRLMVGWDEGIPGTFHDTQDLLAWMVGEEHGLYTLQTIHVADICKPYLDEQHPWLAEYPKDEITPDNYVEHRARILEEYGETLPVHRLTDAALREDYESPENAAAFEVNMAQTIRAKSGKPELEVITLEMDENGDFDTSELLDRLNASDIKLQSVKMLKARGVDVPDYEDQAPCPHCGETLYAPLGLDSRGQSCPECGNSVTLKFNPLRITKS